MRAFILLSYSLSQDLVAQVLKGDSINYHLGKINDIFQWHPTHLNNERHLDNESKSQKPKAKQRPLTLSLSLLYIPSSSTLDSVQLFFSSFF